MQAGKEIVICYASHVLQKPQRRYCTTRKELLAVVKFCRHFRHYLLGRRFVLRTDHNSLVWLMRFRHIEGQLARWLEELSTFDMEIVHRPGKKHANADGLSRMPDSLPECDCYQAGAAPESLPCGGCRYCVRAHQQWDRFDSDVDDVIPLASKTATPVVRKATIVSDQKTDTDVSALGPMAPTDQDIDNPYDPDATLPYYEGAPGSNWLSGYQPELIRAYQMEDPDLAPIMTWIEKDHTPTDSELRLHSPATRSLWLCRSFFQMFEGVLYYKFIDSQDRDLCLVVPARLKSEVLEHCHDSKVSGHLGQKKTVDKVRRSFLWYNLRRDCEEYVRSCATCNKNKKPHVRPKAPLEKFHAGYPMERVHLDILGPFNTSEDGNNYVLMMVDQFSKWVEMAALPNQSAQAIAEKFLVHFIVTFGCPLEVHTDQGRNFDGDLFRALCAALDIAKTRTTPYHPSSNGQVERFNTLVLSMIRCYIAKKNRKWDRDLPFLAMALHSMVNRQTGYTPNRIMLGRETIQPIHILLGIPQNGQSRMQPSSWVTRLVENMQKVHGFVRANLRTSQLRQKRDYDLRVVERKYNAGDLVYKIDSTSRVGQSRKLRSPWCGPFLVISSNPPLYRIKGRKGESVVHHDRLKRCDDRDIPTWLRRLRHEFFKDFSYEESLIEDIDETLLYCEDDPGLQQLFKVVSESSVDQRSSEPCVNSGTMISNPVEQVVGKNSQRPKASDPNIDFSFRVFDQNNQEMQPDCIDTSVSPNGNSFSDDEFIRGPKASTADRQKTRRGRVVMPPVRFR